MKRNNDIVLAFPKGRILEEIKPLFENLNIKPEAAFYDDSSRALMFSTNNPHFKIIKIRSFDVATFVAFGAAEVGICGNDVLMEFDFPEVYSPIDLKLGACRLSLAADKESAAAGGLSGQSHIRIATKYPNLSKKYFAAKGIQAECIKLNGAIELAPKLGLADNIVDLVSTGKTLKENGLIEIEKIADVTSRLIVNRTSAKTKGEEINAILAAFRESLEKLGGQKKSPAKIKLRA